MPPDLGVLGGEALRERSEQTADEYPDLRRGVLARNAFAHIGQCERMRVLFWKLNDPE
jgi:hypothetical protein